MLDSILFLLEHTQEEKGVTSVYGGALEWKNSL